MEYRNIQITREDPIVIVRLSRPGVHNALNLKMMSELMDALEAMDRDESIRCMVLTGNEKAFASGGDINELADSSGLELMQSEFLTCWDRIGQISKPLIAAVCGHALGGGFELVLLCDIVVAGENARFGIPELSLGIIPGAGGTQRLARLLGKHRTLEILFTGRRLNALEAVQIGIANRVAPVEICLDIARELAHEISRKAPLAVKLAKQSVLKAYDTSLREGIDFERKCFYLLCTSEDKREGMRAFLEKRKPDFTGG
jgi:enoyl-CoA hydratase